MFKNILTNFVNRTMSSSAAAKPIETAIEKVLKSNLSPLHLEIINESHMHNVAKGSETHFKVFVVSDKFNEMKLIQRHRLVANLIKEELAEKFVHALSIDAKTPAQWDGKHIVEPSPKCLGGFGK